jgi:hypothetical protein
LDQNVFHIVNLLKSSNHCIQIVDFDPIVLDVVESETEEGMQLGGMSGEEWRREREIFGRLR